LADGHIKPDYVQEIDQSGSYETFFTETGKSKYVPRSIFIDLDPSVRKEWQPSLNEIQTDEIAAL
jgi:hypothetical protein